MVLKLIRKSTPEIVPVCVGLTKKPSGCDECPLRARGIGFVPDEYPAEPKVAMLLEAPGEDEAVMSRPLVGRAGQAWLRKLIYKNGFKREDVLIANTLRCFANPRTLVYTPQGYRQLYTLTEGDLVLTHTGQFKRVLASVRLPVDKRIMRIGVRVNNSIDYYRVSHDHLFLSPLGWVAADLLQRGDILIGIAEKCCICGKLCQRSVNQLRSDTLCYCSHRCHNIDASQKGRTKLAEIMKTSYEAGQRDRYKITQKANEKTRELVERNLHNLQHLDYESRYKSRVSAAVTRQQLGLSDNVWIGFGEAEVAQILASEGIDYTAQYAIDKYNYDFCVGNKLIEVCGPGARSNGARIPQDAEKKRLAESLGYEVVYVPDYSPKDVLTLLKNDSHEFYQTDYEVVSVEVVTPRSKGLWSLQVEGDESYVAKALIHHNCRPSSMNEYPIGKLRVEAERHCRLYDDQLVKFRPDLFLVTIHPAMLLRSSAMTRLVQRDVRRAFEFAAKGYRPCLLMGDKAMNLVAPWLKDGVKRWRGHWWEQDWSTKFDRS